MVHCQNNDNLFLEALQEPARLLFLTAYILLPFFQNTAIFLLILTTPFLVSRFPNLKQIFFLTTLFIALCVYILLGSDEFRPKTKGLIQAVSHLVTALAVVCPLFFIKFKVVKSAIICLCISVVIFVFFEGIQTLIFHPFIALQRFMIHPITGLQVHSTGQTNSMALAVGFLLLLSGQTLWGTITLFPFTLISIFYANRTGMILAALFIIIMLFRIVKSSNSGFRLIILFMIALFLIGIYLIMSPDIIDFIARGFLRLSKYGLETERTDLMKRGVQQILSGNYLLGGGQLEYWRDYPWYHNLYLDAYRVAGIPAIILFLCLTSISFSTVLISKSNNLICVWLIALSVTITSVPVEGSLMEYALIFTIFSYALIIKSPQIINKLTLAHK